MASNGNNELQASPKALAIDAMLTALTGRSRQQYIAEHICMTCGKPAEHFSNELSIREYTISGMCQACQDSVFAEPNEADDIYI